jgi:hypothetical protein
MQIQCLNAVLTRNVIQSCVVPERSLRHSGDGWASVEAARLSPPDKSPQILQGMILTECQQPPLLGPYYSKLQSWWIQRQRSSSRWHADSTIYQRHHSPQSHFRQRNSANTSHFLGHHEDATRQAERGRAEPDRAEKNNIIAMSTWQIPFVASSLSAHVRSPLWICRSGNQSMSADLSDSRPPATWRRRLLRTAGAVCGWIRLTTIVIAALFRTPFVHWKDCLLRHVSISKDVAPGAGVIPLARENRALDQWWRVLFSSSL